MTQTAMTLAEFIRKISDFSLLANRSEGLAHAAESDASETVYWEDFDGAIAGLLGLIASPEGQAVMAKLLKVALIVDQCEPYVVTGAIIAGVNLRENPDTTPLKPCGPNWFPGSSGPWAEADQAAPMADIGGAI